MEGRIPKGDIALRSDVKYLLKRCCFVLHFQHGVDGLNKWVLKGSKALERYPIAQKGLMMQKLILNIFNPDSTLTEITAHSAAWDVFLHGIFYSVRRPTISMRRHFKPTEGRTQTPKC